MSVMRKPLHPACVMILYWSAILLIYFLGPISLTPGLSFLGALFLLSHILLFITGSTVPLILLYKKKSVAQNLTSYNDGHLGGQLICTLLFIGVIGGVFSIADKFADLAGLGLMSTSKLRTLKAQSLLHGGEAHSSILSAMAFIFYPAGFVGLVTGTLRYEHISRFVRLLLYLFVVIIFGVAILAGGRSPIMLLLLFVGISCYMRTAVGNPFMPRSRTLRWGTVVLLLTFMVYSSIIWTVRSAEANKNTAQYLQHAASVWGATPNDYLVATSAWLNRPGLTFSVLGPVFYLTQNLSITEKILAEPDDIPTMYGSYHIDLFAAVLRRIPEEASLLNDGYETLLRADIYGYFTGAWGALFIDYGYFSLVAAMLWGGCAGISWVSFKNNPSLLSSTFYVFWIYSIMISFATPPFGFSNSFMVFVWFVVFYLMSEVLSVFLERLKARVPIFSPRDYSGQVKVDT